MNPFVVQFKAFGQAACCNWSTAEEESVVRDPFIRRVRDTDVQRKRIRKNPDHDGTLKLVSFLSNLTVDILLR